MADASKFEGLKKLPDTPAMKLLADANVDLKTPLELEARTSIPEAMALLAARGEKPVVEKIDIMRLLSQALPPREAVWWACLAARDIAGHDASKVPDCLAAAEAWVFRPGDETRAAAFKALSAAKPSDKTSLSAMCAVYAKGTFGPEELDDAELAPGLFGNIVLGMQLTSLGEAPKDEPDRIDLLLARGLDIAKGGNGRLDKAGAGGAEMSPTA